MPNFFDQFDQAPAKEAKVTGNFFDQFDAKPEPTPETESFSTLRQIADVPLQFGKGAVSGVRMIADAFGAGSETSKALKSSEDYLAGLMSAQSKQDSKEIARIMDEAKDKGVLDQVVAGVKALSVAPVDTLVNAFGTSAPAILGGLATTVVGAPTAAVGAIGAGIGAAMGAGTIKGTIYDAVKEELSKTDMPKDQIEARAKLAQDYDGKNLDMILAGAAIGTLGASTGIEPAIAKRLSKNIIQKTAKEKTAEETRNIAKQGIRKYATKEGLTEFGTESSQAGQEQFSENLALRREGYDVPLTRGVISNAVLEGIAGLGMGAGVGATTAYKAKKEVARVNQETKDIIKQDLESKGIDATDEQLDEIVVNVNKIREEQQNVSGDNTSTNVGTNQPSIPVSEDQTESIPTTGAGEGIATDVDATGSVPAGVGDRKNDESSALETKEPIVDEKGAFIPGATKNDLMPAQAGFKEIGPDDDLYDEIGEATFISSLDVQPNEQGKGYGKKLLSAITEWADKNDKRLVLNPAASGGLTQEQLNDWYGRNGFKQDGNFMVREPNQTTNINQEEQEAARLKDIEDQRNAINSAYQEYNQSEQTPVGNTTEAKTTKTVESGTLESGLLDSATLDSKTFEELIEIRNKYQAKFSALLSKNASIPRAGTKKRVEYDKLQVYLTDIGNRIDELGRKKIAEEKTIESTPTETVEATPVEQKTELVPDEDKIRKANNIPQLETLPKELQENKVVQSYHNLFNEWLTAKSLGDVEEQRKISYKISDLRIDLPEGHPAALGFPKPKGKDTGKGKGKGKGKTEQDKNGPKLSEDSAGLISTITDAFKNWFGNSKAVNPDGTPMRLYHGTTADIDQFKLSSSGALGAGVYLTPNSHMANNYAGIPHPDMINVLEVQGFTTAQALREMQRTGEDIPNGNVLPVYARIENPLILRTDKNEKGYYPDPMVDALIQLGVDKTKAEKIVEKAYDEQGYVGKQVMSRAQKQGYDGIFQYRNGVLSEVVAFSPNQVKSIFNKNPTFSPKISLSEGSDVLFRPVHPTVDEAIRNGDLRGALKALAKTGGQYLSSLANRFLSLDTNVVIGYDLQTKLIPKYLDTVKGQKNRVLQLIEILYPDIYDAHFNESLMLDPLTQLRDSFNKLENGEFGINIKSYEQDVANLVHVYNSAFAANKASGFFYDNSVSFNSNSYGGTTTTQTFVHEVTHGFTHWAINNPDLLNEEQKKALDNLNKLYEYAKAHTKNPELYGYKTLHEFVAEAFSSVKFQKELREMSANSGTEVKQSLWSKFMHTVYRLLNTVSINKETGKPYGTNNVLFHTLANTDVLFSAKEGQDTSGINSPLMAPNKFSVKNGKIKTNTRETGFINSLIGNRQKFSSLNKNNLSSFFSTLNDQTRRYLLGGLTLDQLTDIAGENLPQFKEYVREIDAMLDTRNKILLEGEQSIKNWSHLLESNPIKAEELGTAMIEATFAKLDPDPTTKGYDVTKFKHTKQGQRALEAWKKLESGEDADKAVAIYREVRKFYETRMEEYINIELDRLVEREQANKTDPAKIKQLKDAREDVLRKDIIKPYFPIKRFGDFWIQVGKGNDKIFMQFENAAARNAALQEVYDDLIKQGRTEDEILGQGGLLDYGNQFKTEMSGKLADYAQLSKLHDLINNTTTEVQAGSAVDKAESLRAKLNENMDQLYLELMPSESIKKMFIHRKNIAGPSQDMLRAFAVSRQRVAYQRSRFQHLPKLFLTIEAANKRLASMPFEERTKWRDYVRELELNLKTAVLEPPKQSKLTTWLTQFGFLQYLTSPASAIVNIMAVPGIYIPAAAPKYGAGNVATSLAKYNRMLGGTGYVDERTGKIEFLSLARANLEDLTFAGTEANKIELPTGKTLADVYQSGVSRNVIDVTLSHDAAAIGEQPSDEYTGRWQKVMYYSSLPFHAAEKYNRETTFMASFDMAYRKYISKGYTKEKAYDAALDDARDLVQSTMFNYNTINKPRYFRGDLRNVILQFKMYPQHMTVLMFRTFQKGWASGRDAEMAKFKEQIANSPADMQPKLIADKEAELKQLEKESKEQFMGMMGMTFIFSGASGLPLFFIFEAVASAFQAVFGDDDEFFDVDNWFKNWCNRTFGGFVGDSISRGLLSQATGLNFADRMSVNLNDMWFPDVKKSNDEVQYMQNVMTNLLGPTAGALLNYGEALKRYNDGHTERALEAIMPSAIKNVMVGTRYLVEGKALTLKGAELDSNVLPAEALAQMLGFTPEKIAQKQKATIEAKGVEQAILNRHTDLVNAFFIALDSSDADMLERVIKKISKFNTSNPGNAISPDSLYDSVTKRYQDRALSNITGGMSLNKKLVPQLQNMLEYSKD